MTRHSQRGIPWSSSDAAAVVISQSSSALCLPLCSHSFLILTVTHVAYTTFRVMPIMHRDLPVMDLHSYGNLENRNETVITRIASKGFKVLHLSLFTHTHTSSDQVLCLQSNRNETVITRIASKGFKVLHLSLFTHTHTCSDQVLCLQSIFTAGKREKLKSKNSGWITHSTAFFWLPLGTTHALAPQMSLAYSCIVRSLENFPHWAMLWTTMVSQRFRSCITHQCKQSSDRMLY